MAGIAAVAGDDGWGDNFFFLPLLPSSVGEISNDNQQEGTTT